MEDSRYMPHEGIPHLIPLLMFIPSTLLFIFLCFIILTKSPEGMRRYKYVILFVSYSAYQFDVITTLLIPTSLPLAMGLQVSGILGAIFPDSGCYLQVLWITGMNVIGLAITFSFIWREYSLISFEKHPLGIFLHVLHILTTSVVYFFKYKYNIGTCSAVNDCRSYLNMIGSWYDETKAVYCILPSQKPSMLMYDVFMALGIMIVCGNVLKAVIRIKSFMKFHSKVISRHTMHQHKMLLRSLVIQLTCPVFLFIIPVIIIGLLPLCQFIWLIFYPSISEDQKTRVSLIITSTMFYIPSFYSIFHVATVIYFTTPYKKYVAELIGLRKPKVIERVG